MVRIILAAIMVLLMQNTFACTTALISGKYTKDGRPILWKLRDSGFQENKLKVYSDAKYRYIGLINSEDAYGDEIWAGTNAAGFSIMNSASYNLNLNDTSKFKDQEGFFMHEALKGCVTIEDFENLLEKRQKPMGLEAHFGVIDANGGAAYYEVSNYGYVKFDANDPKVAPHGYLIRTNYSFTGEKDKGYGYIRFQTAQNLFYEADAKNRLDYTTIIQDFSRNFEHAILNIDYKKEYTTKHQKSDFINSEDLITRYSSVSAATIVGVKNGDPEGLSTMWVNIAYPATTIAVPVWPDGGDYLPNMLTAQNGSNCWLSTYGLNLKKQAYPIERASGTKYLNMSVLYNMDENGMAQIIDQAEQAIFSKTEEKLRDWRNRPTSPQEIQEFYIWLNTYVAELYQDWIPFKSKK